MVTVKSPWNATVWPTWVSEIANVAAPTELVNVVPLDWAMVSVPRPAAEVPVIAPPVPAFKVRSNVAPVTVPRAMPP